MTSTMERFARARSAFVGSSLIGIAAKGNFVDQLFRAMVELHSQINISWFVLNCAPSVNHLT